MTVDVDAVVTHCTW